MVGSIDFANPWRVDQRDPIGSRPGNLISRDCRPAPHIGRENPQSLRCQIAGRLLWSASSHRGARMADKTDTVETQGADVYRLDPKGISAILYAVDIEDRAKLTELMEPLHAADIADLLAGVMLIAASIAVSRSDMSISYIVPRWRGDPAVAATSKPFSG